MLVRMLPSHVADKWEVYKPMIVWALPPPIRYSPGVETNVLAAILRGDLAVWGAYWPNEPTGKLMAIFTTIEQYEPISGSRSLFIYTLYGTMPLTNRELWQDSIAQLLRHAEARGCYSVSTYTCDRGTISMIERLGGNTEYRLAEINLDTDG